MVSRASEEKLRDRFGLVGQTLGDYQIERVVATGGFGVVYCGSHLVIRQRAAIKVLKLPDALDPQDRDTFVRMFLDEAQTIAALKHPAIVSVLDFKVSPVPMGGDTPWMALEWIEGETLAHQLATRRGRGGRTPRECLDLLAPIFDALALAHARGVVHRDIKPANIMLPSKNSRFAVPARLLDFGIAKVVDPDADPGSGHTETTSPIQAFSLPYAASEQISGRRSGPWTDVHALALTLVEMLVDRPPFAGADRGEVVMQVLSSERPTPARFGVQVGPWEPVLAKALSLAPAERYSNAGEFLTALEREVPAEVVRDEISSPIPPVPTPLSSTTTPLAADGRHTPQGRGRATLPRFAASAVATVAIALTVVLGARLFNRSAPRASQRPPDAPRPAASPISPPPAHTTATPGGTAPAIAVPPTPESAAAPASPPAVTLSSPESADAGAAPDPARSQARRARHRVRFRLQ